MSDKRKARLIKTVKPTVAGEGDGNQEVESGAEAEVRREPTIHQLEINAKNMVRDFQNNQQMREEQAAQARANMRRK